MTTEPRLALNQFPNMFMGMQVYQSPLAVETIEPEFSWIDRIISWNPCNQNLLPKSQTKPTAYMIGQDKLVAHPSIIVALKDIA